MRLESGRIPRHFSAIADPPFGDSASFVRAESQLSTESSVGSGSSGGESRWGVFSSVAFTVILIASSISNIGIGMFDTSMSWLMTSLDPDPMMVSAVQVATSLPLFLLTFPAGALVDLSLIHISEPTRPY